MNKITKEEAFSRGLPKWPQMLVKGTSVTVEQAKEIIFATDTALNSIWSCGTNDKEFEDWFLEATGYNQLRCEYELGTLMTEAERHRRSRIFYAREQAFMDRAGFLRTEYVYNSWASSCFVNGPAGWCHPDGTISFIYNVGKWPDVETVYNEWSQIAQRWPFLDLWVTLMNDECCEDGHPVVTFHVHGGEVGIYDGTLEPVAGLPPEPEFDALSWARQVSGTTYDHEHGLPEAWIDEFVDRVRPIVNAVVEEFPI